MLDNQKQKFEVSNQQQTNNKKEHPKKSVLDKKHRTISDDLREALNITESVHSNLRNIRYQVIGTAEDMKPDLDIAESQDLPFNQLVSALLSTLRNIQEEMKRITKNL